MDDVLAAVVTVEVAAGTGAGFFASPDGFVLTAAHVVEGTGAVTVRLMDGASQAAERIRVDPRRGWGPDPRLLGHGPGGSPDLAARLQDGPGRERRGLGRARHGRAVAGGRGVRRAGPPAGVLMGLALLPLVAGCLILADPATYLGTPEPGDSGGPCDHDDDCLDPQRCRQEVCVPRCVDEDCPGGFTCDDVLYECKHTCLEQDDCREGWTCCDDFERCDIEDWGTCLRDA